MTRSAFIRLITQGAFLFMAAPIIARAEGQLKTPLDMISLSRAVGEFLDKTPYNRLPGTDTRIYGAPLFGASSAQDPLYRKLKEVVGSDHYMPEDLFPGAKTVISYFLPYSKEVSKANYGTEDSPALWLLAHQEGATAAELVRRFIGKSLASVDAKAFVPFHDSRYRNKKLVSNWSERHVAFVSGLGTFGLHKSLITEKGSSGRLDSIITDLEFAPTRRDYSGVYDYCAKCYSCVKRCPVGAIKETGKSICACAKKVLAGKASPEQAVCGKCLTEVPCENCKPATGNNGLSR